MKAPRLSTSFSSVRVHLDDLQAEIEAGDRCADRIHRATAALDGRVATHLRPVARAAALNRCVSELRASIAQQRAILRDLRAALNQVRDQIAQRSR